MRRSVVVLLAVMGLFLALRAGTALAAHCYVPEKPVGAGSKIIVSIDPTTGEDTVTVTNEHWSGHAGFATLDFDGDGVGDVDLFLKPVTPGLQADPGDDIGNLPEGAHNAGPGDNECDGKGVDDLLACP